MWIQLLVLHITCLATVGVCAFRAAASVAAFFIMVEWQNRYNV